jgi:hypothetical protein
VVVNTTTNECIHVWRHVLRICPEYLPEDGPKRPKHVDLSHVCISASNYSALLLEYIWWLVLLHGTCIILNRQTVSSWNATKSLNWQRKHWSVSYWSYSGHTEVPSGELSSSAQQMLNYLPSYFKTLYQGYDNQDTRVRREHFHPVHGTTQTILFINWALVYSTHHCYTDKNKVHKNLQSDRK